MHVVLGLSLSPTSAVWVLVDTRDGSIIADEVVALDRADEIASAAARSVQSFALRSDRDIEAVRLVWDDDDPVARRHGIRLRTKLRLFGFDNIETVTEEEAREGRNRTARHIAPHMVFAYGAARAAANEDDGTGVLRRIAEKMPHRESAGVPVMPSMAERAGERARAVVAAIPGGVAGRAAAAAFLAVVGGLVGYALLAPGSTTHEAPDTVAAEAVLPAPEQAAPPADAALPAPPAEAVLPAPLADAALPAPPDEAVLPAPPAEAALPVEPEPEPGYAWAPDLVSADEVTVTPGVPDALAAEVSTPTVHAMNPAAPQPVSTMIGIPHLSGAGPAAGPAQAVAAPVAPAAPVTTAPVPAAPPAPPAPAGPLGALFRALP